MSLRSGTRALVLAAHGSGRGGRANAQLRRLAQAVRDRRVFDEVAVAFHLGEPGFATVLDELVSDSATVVPVMTSAGHFTRTVLPAALARNACYGTLPLTVTPPLGTHPGIPALAARRIGELLRTHRLERSDTAVLLVGHGTRRHPASRHSTLALADALRTRGAAGEVASAFLDDDPGVLEAFRSLVKGVVLVIPFLIGGGDHTLDLAAGGSLLPADPSERGVIVDQPIGAAPEIVDLLLDLGRRHAPSSTPLRRRASSRRGAVGAVHLVGAGPGDPELITVRGLDRLRRADVVVHDRLAGPELLAQARPDAELVDVGKGPGLAPLAQEEINRLLVARARRGLDVVRLKGGDPFVFGRGSEELAACRVAGIACEVIPGISSALAAPAAAGIPVTARGVARGFAVLTARHAGGDTDPAPFAGIDTLVLLMGRAGLARFAERLIGAGRDPDTPAACVQSATTPAQRVTVATLGTIAAAADRDGLESPVVTVVGEVAALAAEGAGVAPLLEQVAAGA
ncbi:MAG TPA: uroporphyrinogen-III C-methyltransferase [Gemmatimonadales bacterium]|nr:uroporphyrinogen-III C-methyltransferase [Gemmatimonadales bacterium]